MLSYVMVIEDARSDQSSIEKNDGKFNRISKKDYVSYVKIQNLFV